MKQEWENGELEGINPFKVSMFSDKKLRLGRISKSCEIIRQLSNCLQIFKKYHTCLTLSHFQVFSTPFPSLTTIHPLCDKKPHTFFHVKNNKCPLRGFSRSGLRPFHPKICHHKIFSEKLKTVNPRGRGTRYGPRPPTNKKKKSLKVL